MAGNRGGDQQQQRERVGRVGDLHPDPDIDTRGGNKDYQADDEAQNLLVRPWREMAAGDRVKHGKADGRDDGDDENERPVDLEQLVGD